MTRFNLNPDLRSWLDEHATVIGTPQPAPVAYRARKWRVRDRLSERDLVRMVMAYETGIATKGLAAKFKINIKSVRKVAREMGVERWTKPTS